MKYYVLIIFLSIISFCFSDIPNWDLNTSGKDLLSSSSKYEYISYSRIFSDNKELKMIKRFTKLNNNITCSNIVSFNNSEKEVPFDNIRSSHYVFNTYIICPYGKYHPYDFNTGQFLIPSGAEADDDWDLKCEWHPNSLYFFVFYSRKRVYKFFFSYYNEMSWDNIDFPGEFYDYEINKKNIEGKDLNYRMIYYLTMENQLLLINSYLDLKSKKKTNTLFNSYILQDINLPNTKGFIKDNTYNFYFITYNDIHTFYSGYTNTTVDDNYIIKNNSLKFNSTSPFAQYEFSDEVEIKEINFTQKNKFIYYKLKNKNNDIYYHGIIDIELNQIIFNTNETINTFIPYSNMAMLAITPNTVYRICAYNDGDNCTDYCPEGYIIDTSGNICGPSCKANQYIFIPSGVCIDNCNTSIYIIQGQKCGLCKYFDNEKPYKFINGTKCLDKIPEGAKIYDNDSSILICNEGYYFENDSCYNNINCYETCEKCIGPSEDEKNQNCTECKSGYVLEKQNCLSKCSYGYGLINGECQECNNKNYCNNFSINSCDCIECIDHYYLNNNECYECDSNCENCFNKPNNCISCDNSSFLLDSQCLKCTVCNETEVNSCKCKSCKEGYFLDNYQCKKCSDDCKTCKSNLECDSCFNGYILENNKCVKCHENCESCFASSQNKIEQNCLSCKSGKYLYENNCVDNCEDGLYIYNNKECKKCNEHCKTCEKGEEENNENCLSCDINNGYKYLVDAEGFGKNCVNECPNGTIIYNEKCILNNKNEKKEEKVENNYTKIILGISIVLGIITIIFISITIYFCFKKRNTSEIEDKSELMKNIGENFEIFNPTN